MSDRVREYLSLAVLVRVESLAARPSVKERTQEATFSYEGTIRAMVLENPYAKIRFPADLLVGPFDQRWRLEAGRLSLGGMGSELTRLR